MSKVLFPKFELVDSRAMLLYKFPSEHKKYLSDLYYAPIKSLPDSYYEVMCLCANDVGDSISNTLRVYCNLESYSFRVSFERNKYTALCMQHSMLIKPCEDEKIIYLEDYDRFKSNMDILE